MIGRFVHLVLETFPDLSIIHGAEAHTSVPQSTTLVFLSFFQFLHPGAFHRSLTSNITFMFDVITLLVWNSEF